MNKTVIVGAGPGGIAAAVAAAEKGSQVTLIDENPGLGGQVWRQNLGKVKDKNAKKWIDRLFKQNIKFLPSTRVLGSNSTSLDCSNPEHAHFNIDYDSLILATGAKELFLPFPRWTLPNVIGCGGAQALVKSGLDVRDKRIVVSGSGPLLLAVAYFLKKQGAVIAGIFEQASSSSLNNFARKIAFSHPGKILQGIKYRLGLAGVSWKKGWWVKKASGSEILESLTVTNGQKEQQIDCDYLACGFGLVPNIELPIMLGCQLDGESVKVDERQMTSKQNIYAIGELTGIGGLDKALLEGEIAALALNDIGINHLMSRKDKELKFTEDLKEAFQLRDEVKHLAIPDTIFCRCEDVLYKDICDLPNQRDAKLKTRCGMGACQGKICSTMGRELFGWELNKVSYPISSVTIDSLME
ncbi:MAG: FAD-dependent oxidoreductase [Lentisphaeraceae bacterium]|nr:FAD-dependent oxidoreductase [Lentisphaeraceae bacterium]